MQSYLILSPAYYGDINDTEQIRIKLRYAYDMLESKNMTLDFIAFRYDNSDILSINEYYMLFEVITFCKTHNITLLLNLSRYKLEMLILLWIHGFNLGIHFKESDMPLLHDNICLVLRQIYFIIYSLQDDITLRDKLKIIYNSFLFLCKSVAKIFEPLCVDMESFLRFITPLHNALNNYKTISQKNKLDKNFCPIFVSTHNLQDLSRVLSFGANYATISPIFYDKFNKALGVKYLHKLPPHLKKKHLL